MPATHQGVFRGIEPNGKAVRFTGIDILRIKNGRVVASVGRQSDAALF